MSPQTFYDGKDFERAICEKMGIPHDKFRDYHDVVGGEFKDLWHVILTLEYGEINNGQLVNVAEWIYDWEDSESKLEEAYGAEERWWEPFLAAVEAVIEDHGGSDLYIHFWW